MGAVLLRAKHWWHKHMASILSCMYCTLEAEGGGSREYSREADLSDELSGNLGGVLRFSSYKTLSRSRTAYVVQQD